MATKEYIPETHWTMRSLRGLPTKELVKLSKSRNVTKEVTRREKRRAKRA